MLTLTDVKVVFSLLSYLFKVSKGLQSPCGLKEMNHLSYIIIQFSAEGRSNCWLISVQISNYDFESVNKGLNWFPMLHLEFVHD